MRGGKSSRRGGRRVVARRVPEDVGFFSVDKQLSLSPMRHESPAVRKWTVLIPGTRLRSVSTSQCLVRVCDPS